MTTQILNPLDKIVSESSDNVSTSRMDNSTPGRCPKCKSPMITALVSTEEVFYCDKCRVTLPIPTN